jgi:gas vesicle protein
MKRSIGAILLSAVGFTAGVAAGLLLAPKSGKESRKWISAHTDEARNWVGHKGERLIKESEERIKKIQAGIKDSIPDLYQATADIHFEEEELEDA